MGDLKKHLEQLFKECEHGDEQHRQWLKGKFDDYMNREAEADESAFVDKLIKELPGYGIDTSTWEYDHGDCCYGGAVEFIARCIKSIVKEDTT